MIEGHGNNLYNYTKGQIEVDFSSNIAFNNRSSEVIGYLADHLDTIANYPDTSAKRLTSMLANHHGVESESVMVTNGSCEAFYTVAHLLSRRHPEGCRTLVFTPSFSEYEDSCRLYGHELHFEEITRVSEIDYSCYDSVWIGIPNNPNGYLTDIETIKSLAHRYPHCHFIVDMAYSDLCNGVKGRCRSEIIHNLITIDSLTKSFGIPGIRLGYLIANSESIESLQLMRPPWSVNTMALVAGEYIMERYEMLRPDLEELYVESQRVQELINEIDGIEVTPSRCNFFLCELSNGRGVEELREYLVKRDKLLIRNASNFRGLHDGHFRIAVSQRSNNDKLINALKEWRSTTLY